MIGVTCFSSATLALHFHDKSFSETREGDALDYVSWKKRRNIVMLVSSNKG